MKKKITGERVPVWLSTNSGAALDLGSTSYGLLAITRTYTRFGGFSSKSYAITHTPTGRTIRDCLLSRAQAARLCVALIESGVPWAKLTLDNCGKYSKEISAIIKRAEPDLS